MMKKQGQDSCEIKFLSDALVKERKIKVKSPVN